MRARWMLAGALFFVAPLAARAQMTMRPTAPPAVTAESEHWYLEGEPLTFSGAFYYPAGPQVYFNPYEMERSASYRGIPLYSLKTREPYSVLFVPLDRGLMQPYERRREGEKAGTVGTSAPSFPVARDTESAPPDAGLQAPAPPFAGSPALVFEETGRSEPADAPMDITGDGKPVAPAGPLTTARRPVGLNAFYVDYQGRRWFSSGKAVARDQSAYVASGAYKGFTVYVDSNGPADRIYIAVSQSAAGLLTPYSTRR